MSYACPCCEHLTLGEPPPDTYGICPVCYWQDDGVQYHDPDYAGGANKMSLNEARLNFLRLGAIDEASLASVRRPTEEEEVPERSGG